MPGTLPMQPSHERTAFVTGGTGFVGLNLVKELMIRGDVERCLVIAPGSLVEPVDPPAQADARFVRLGEVLDARLAWA